MLEELIGKSKYKKQIVAGAILLGASFFGWQFAFQPLILQIKKAEISQNELTQKGSVFGSIVATENKIFSYKPFFVEPKDRAELISSLSALAGQSLLTINSITPEEQMSFQSGGEIEKIYFRIDAMGDYHSLGQFAGQVESLKHFAKIVRLDMSGSDATDYSTMGSVSAVSPSGGKSFKISMTIGFFYPPKEILA